jgi:hypothetical protein
MSATSLDLWTRVAILVLEVGSVAVFAWFLVDVVRLSKRHERRRRHDPPPPGSPLDGPPYHDNP